MLTVNASYYQIANRKQFLIRLNRTAAEEIPICTCFLVANEVC